MTFGREHEFLAAAEKELRRRIGGRIAIGQTASY
jgi:hypothetical protein